MRNYVKLEILQLIESLYQAHREIEDIVGKGQIAAGQNMLGECQEYAINLGNIVEQIEGEACVTVSYLEKYCEVLFRVHESLQTGSNVCKLMKKLDNALSNIENSVKHDIPVRKEVVFLPYKASMWDSLESVYLAAKDDPDCDAYCVPIPYFDRNADGSLGQMHYEGGEYPKNIEVIDWRKYNLADRKPDVIYIHNPYDANNRVTCVHPDYFSDKLKKYTDELVYIPYFVLQEIDPQNQQAIDGMKHFCFLPGIINADKVILQSENMKQIYIAEYLKAAKLNGLQGEHIDRAALEKKFLGMGSPKIDKVLRTKKEDLEIPQEWLKIIEKPDGTRKKIIFYNTSIGALLEHNEKMLVKMESVFEIFKAHKEEMALLWRPHPLIPSTIKSMRPQLWVKYKQIVEKYKAEGWGIYDDTADMDRAVVLSDAYYGDPSSVVEVYKETGKPIILQNVMILDGQPGSIELNSIYRNKKGNWFIGSIDNSIYYMDEKAGTINYLSTIPWADEDVYRRYPNCFQYDNSIICLPDRGAFILIYDIVEKNFRKCEIENPYNVRIGIYNFWSENSSLWCVSYGLNQIIEFDLEKMRVVGQYNIFNSFEKWVGYGAAKDKGNIICVSRNSTTISVFNIFSKQATNYDIPIDEVGFNTILCENGRVWLTGYHEKVYVWDTQEDSILILDKFPAKFTRQYISRDRALFSHCYNTEKWILLFPWYNHVLAVNKETFHIQTLSLVSELDRGNEYYSICHGEWNEYLEIYCSDIKGFITLDTNSVCGEERVWEINELDTMLIMTIQQQRVLQEQKGYLSVLFKAI